MCRSFNMSHKADSVNKFFPSLFCLVCVPSGTVEYSSDKLKTVEAYFQFLPEELREFFTVVEYRAITINERLGKNGH